MKFRTAIETPQIESKISYEKKIFFIGSCFSDSIGNKFKDYFFDTRINPFGVLYNPLSIKKDLENIINEKEYTNNDIFFHNNLWKNYDFHSDFSDSNQSEVLKKINNSIVESSEFLKKTDFIFITFGTAWIYELSENNSVVANCHKVDANKFNRRLLTVDEITENYLVLINKLKQFNPNLKFFFTVSPVRHLKDGFAENQISKSTLILAVNEINKKFADVEYFPSYEIVIDDLRDYRYYSADLVHISDFAIDYIWEIIIDIFFSETTKNELKLTIKLSKTISHRVMKKNKDELKKFVISMEGLIKKIQELNPKIKLEKAIKRKEELKNLLVK